MYAFRWRYQGYLVMPMANGGYLHRVVPCWRGNFDILGVGWRKISLLDLCPRSGSKVSFRWRPRGLDQAIARTGSEVCRA